MSIIKLTEGEITVEPPEQGPVRIKSLDEHKWRLRASTEGLSPHVELTCEDPCAMPYCYHTRRLCCCVWACTSEQHLDVVLDEMPVTVSHEDHTGWNYWGDDYEPGYLMLTPAINED